MSSLYSGESSRRPSAISITSSIGSKRHDSLTEDFSDNSTLLVQAEKFRSDRLTDSGLRRLRSVSAKEAEDVAAATRFRLQLEQQEPIPQHEDDALFRKYMRPSLPLRSTSLLDTLPLPGPDPEDFRRQEARQMKRRKTPEPIIITDKPQPPQEVQSASLPSRLSRRRIPGKGGEVEATAKFHRRHVTISEGRGISSMLLLNSPTGLTEHTPPLPFLSPSRSIATPQLPDMPLTPLSLNPPNEDQIRREIELFAIQDGTQTLLDQRYRYQELPSLMLDSDGEEETHSQNFERRSLTKKSAEDDRMSMVSVTPSMKRRKSIFSIFQRKSELEKLLDLYLDEEETAKPVPVQKRPSLVRRMTRSSRRRPGDVPEVPPLPSNMPPRVLQPG